jgi:hypothetical protein
VNDYDYRSAKKSPSNTIMGLKLVDFGTSRFSKKGKFEYRHWRVVDETVQRIFKPEFGRWSVRKEWPEDRTISDPMERLNHYLFTARAMETYAYPEK